MAENVTIMPASERLQFPLDETYLAFGDGSETAGGVFYGLVLIPESAIEQVQQSIEEVKLKHGGKANSPIHCRELFNRHGREKTEWKHLSDAHCMELCGDILRELTKFNPKHLLAFLPQQCFPKRFRLIGKNGHPDLVHDTDSKWLTLWAFFRIAALLDPAEVLTPVAAPRPANFPSWQMVVRRAEQGMRVRKIFLDREQTKVRWFSKSLQWISIAQDLVIEAPLGRSILPLQLAISDKHSLIDVADVFTYSAARQITREAMVYPNLETEIHLEILNWSGEEMILGQRIQA
ncbi:MAG TPA: hypothetical protein VFW05_11895 [Verrucomicrobiae bacterium]|nr:hypothetical protein [Verrucomicrobiae bacterium]